MHQCDYDHSKILKTSLWFIINSNLVCFSEHDKHNQSNSRALSCWVYTVYTIYTVYTKYTVYIVYTIYTVYSIRGEYIRPCTQCFPFDSCDNAAIQRKNINKTFETINYKLNFFFKYFQIYISIHFIPAVSWYQIVWMYLDIFYIYILYIYSIMWIQQLAGCTHSTVTQLLCRQDDAATFLPWDPAGGTQEENKRLDQE